MLWVVHVIISFYWEVLDVPFKVFVVPLGPCDGLVEVFKVPIPTWRYHMVILGTLLLTW